MNKFLNTSTFVLAVVGSIVLLNVISLRAFTRFDVTKDKAYSLSGATKETLSALEENVTVTAYFTDKLPAPYAENSRYVRDLLAEFRAQSHGKVSFEFIDPLAEGEKEGKREVKRDIFGRTFRDATQMEKDLASQGIQPVEIRVVEEDQAQTKKAFMALVIKYQEKKEVIPLVQQVGTLEYDLTSLIRKMSRTKSPVLAILTGHEEPKPEEHLRQLQAILGQTYQVKTLDLTGKDKVDDDVDGVLVIGPKTPFKPNELKALDQFLMKGKSAGFFLDAIRVDPRTMESQPCDHGLAQLLSTYGVTVGDRLVADGQSYAQINVSEQRGFMMIQMPVPYPFIPLVQRLENDSPISKGLGNVDFPFATEVEAKAADGREVLTLAKSTTKSWLENKPFNIDPRREWRNEQVTPNGPHPLMVQVSGKLTSHFASEAGASSASSAAPGAAPVLAASTGPARLVVAGSSAWLQDEFLQRPNVALAANVADWLVLDPAMLAMRTRGLASAPLSQELSAGTKNAVKFANALGLPLVLIVFGLIRWRSREARRGSVTVAEV